VLRPKGPAFSHVSVFSDLNNLTDISLNPVCHDMRGVTPKELEANCMPGIDPVAQERKLLKIF
jgi:hypothetical protein